MPQVPQSNFKSNLKLRMMLLGAAMTMKTTWAVNAAEAGFNVIYVDGDGNSQPIAKLSKEAYARVYHIDVVDTVHESNHAWFWIWAMNKAKANNPNDRFFWNEDKKVQVGENLLRMADKNSHHVMFDVTKTTTDDIVVTDSWTSLIRSFVKRYFAEEDIDITLEVDRKGNWGDYKWTGLIADMMIEFFRSLPCHVIIICHEEVIEKKDSDGKVLSTKIKPISTSRAQAEKLQKFFTDILHFDLTGQTFWVESQSSSSITAGSRSLPPFRKMWKDMQFKDFAKECGLVPSGRPCEAVKYFKPGEVYQQPASVQPPSAPAVLSIDGDKKPSVSITSSVLSSLNKGKVS